MDPTVATGPANRDNYKWKAFSAMAIGLFVGVMDFAGIGVVVPTVADEFGLALSTASWIIIAAALTISVVLLPVGGLSDIAGRKRSYMVGMVLFAAGALGAALAPSLIPLLIARVVEAVGAAIVMANGTAIVAIVFPPGERGKGMGLITMCVGLASITGPLVAGGMIDAFGWRSFFYLVAALAVVGVAWAAWALDEDRISTRRGGSLLRYDWPGAILSAAALTVLIVVLKEGNRLGWASVWTVGGGALAAALLISFIVRELRVRSPMFDLHAFANMRFSWAVSTRFLGFLGGSGWFFLMPFYLQDILGYTASKVGLIIFPGALGFAVLGAFSGRYSDRFGVKPFTVSGLVLAIIGGLMLASLNESSKLYLIMPALLTSGIGMGLWVAPNLSAAMAAVERSSYGVVAAFVNLVRNTASVTAVALVTAIVVGVMASRGFEADLSVIGESGSAEVGSAFLTGARYAYLALAGFGVVALFAALKTRDPVRRATTATETSGPPAGPPTREAAPVEND